MSIARSLTSYVGIGAGGALSYVLLSSLLSYLAVAPWLASFASYVMLIPVVYDVQRRVAFQSDAPHRSAFPKYLSTQLLGITLSAVLPPFLSDHGNLPPPVGFVGVAAVIAVTSFFLLQFWAFKGVQET